MNLSDLVALQCQFDNEHGWTTKTTDPAIALQATSDDLVGLIGEIGEFANIVKKLKLTSNTNESDARESATLAQPRLSEELIDALIYLVRIAVHWNIDLETEYLRKLAINRRRFTEYEKEPSK